MYLHVLGIYSLIDNTKTSSAVKKGASIMNSAGGFQSKQLVSMLLHVILCMGWDGKVLYNREDTYYSSNRKLSVRVNPSAFVYKCVHIALLTYMKCRRSQ